MSWKSGSVRPCSKAMDHAPAGASKEVYASLFTSSTVNDRVVDTYTSRNRRMR